MAGNRTLFDGSRQERGKSGRVFYRKRHAYGHKRHDSHDRHDNLRHRPRMLKRITNPDVTKALANIVWLGLERLTQIAVAIAISGLLARYFGPDVFGKWQYANTLLLVLSPITWVCGAEILVPTIVNRPAGQLGTVLGSAFVLRMGVSAAALLVTWIVTWIGIAAGFTDPLVGAMLASLLGKEPTQQIEEDLNRLKQMFDDGTTSAQTSPGQAPPVRDRVQEASEASFPASDAPAFNP